MATGRLARRPSSEASTFLQVSPPVKKKEEPAEKDKETARAPPCRRNNTQRKTAAPRGTARSPSPTPSSTSSATLAATEAEVRAAEAKLRAARAKAAAAAAVAEADAAEAEAASIRSQVDDEEDEEEVILETRSEAEAVFPDNQGTDGQGTEWFNLVTEAALTGRAPRRGRPTSPSRMSDGSATRGQPASSRRR